MTALGVKSEFAEDLATGCAWVHSLVVVVEGLHTARVNLVAELTSDRLILLFGISQSFSCGLPFPSYLVG